MYTLVCEILTYNFWGTLFLWLCFYIHFYGQYLLLMLKCVGNRVCLKDGIQEADRYVWKKETD